MTKAERLAAKIQRDRDTLEKQRQVLADSEATLRAEIRHSEAALRDEERKATDKRRYQVGALAEEAGLFAMSNTELAEVFAALVALRRGERPGTVLEGLVGYPERSEVVLENGTGRHPVRRQGEKTRRKKSRPIGDLSEINRGPGGIGTGERAMAHLHFKRTVYKSGGGKATARIEYITRQPDHSAYVQQERYIVHEDRRTSCTNTRAISPRGLRAIRTPTFVRLSRASGCRPTMHDGAASRSRSGRSRSLTS